MAVSLTAFAADVEIDTENRLIYKGDITAAANAQARELYNRATNPPERLVITSNGGRVLDGLELAEWVHEQTLDVEIGDQCLSSCANYVFPAARTKWLRRDSVLVWHGSAWQESFDNKADPEHPEFLPLMREQRIRETRFFEAIHVDQLIPVHGQTGGKLRDRLRRTWGFDYSLDDLKRLGVTEIRLIDGEWDWRKYKPRNARRVIRTSLGDDYQFQLGRFSTD